MHDPSTLRLLQDDLDASLGQWGLGESSAARLLAASENATFLVSGAHDPLVVRVHRPAYHTRAEILSELAWIAAIREAGVVRTPAPVRGADGDLVLGIGRADRRRHAVAFTFEPGREPDPKEDLVASFHMLGAVNARLHDHARRWRRPATFERKRWDLAGMIGPGAYWGDWRAVEGLDADQRAILDRAERVAARRAADYGEGPERFGLIHADLRLANLLVEGDRLSVIDFDDCGFGWFLYDLAAAVSFHEEDPALDRWIAAWVEGYRSVAPLGAEDVAMIPVFVMLRRLMLTAWVAGHAETDTTRDAGPDFAGGTVRIAERFLARFPRPEIA